MKYPEIIIKDGWLLRDNASRHLHELWAKDGEKLADFDEMAHIVKAYKEAWETYEQKIVHGMCELMDIEFDHNIIDVYIAPWFRAFSDPLVIGVTYEPDLFIDILTHELTHRLLTANKIVNIDKNNTPELLEWDKLYGKEHSFNTLVHIPVHALNKAIYLDILKEPVRLERDIKRSQEWEDYKAAWDYVEEHGYKEIIEKLKQSYKIPGSKSK